MAERVIARGRRVVGRRPPGLPVVVGLLALSAAAGLGQGAGGVMIEVAAVPVGLDESGRATLRIRRSERRGELPVRLRLDGTARLGSDYLLAGGAGWPTLGEGIHFTDGESVRTLEVSAVDDNAAEADETIILIVEPGPGYRVPETGVGAVLTIGRNDTRVTTLADAGEGSLRQAITNANSFDGHDTIRFDSVFGPFASPQTIELHSALPVLTGRLTIDGYIPDRLWRPSGVTVSGGRMLRVFEVAAGADVAILSLTVAEGYAGQGGGVLNRGRLVVQGVTLRDNAAGRDGGGLANVGGELALINSTVVGNRAGRGGGLANLRGRAVITNATFSGNRADSGGGLFNAARLRVSNTILANSEAGADCRSIGELDPASTHNLIEAGDGCGEPLISDDPRLGKLAGYNGPTHTLPPGGASPVVNRGANAAAVDAGGAALVWDQRGNGDPRFVAGITDIGAFEKQAMQLLQVDTAEDNGQQGCTRSRGDCSLRGAITLANLTPEPDVLTFDPAVFSAAAVIRPVSPLPEIVADLTLDAGAAAGVAVRGPYAELSVAPAVKVVFNAVRVRSAD